jgi:hypothetical protein
MLKWIAIVLAILLIGSNGFWLYAAVDLMVTEKYRQQEEYERRHQIEALVRLTDRLVQGMDKDRLRIILEDQFPDYKPFEKEGYLNSLWISFEIGSNNEIVGVEVYP